MGAREVEAPPTRGEGGLKGQKGVIFTEYKHI